MKRFLLSTTLDQVAQSFNGIMKQIIGPVMTVVGVAAVAYAIVLGVQYAKAEDAEGRKKVQGRLIGACVGAVIIIAAITIIFSVNWGTIWKALGAA